MTIEPKDVADKALAVADAAHKAKLAGNFGKVAKIGKHAGTLGALLNAANATSEIRDGFNKSTKDGVKAVAEHGVGIGADLAFTAVAGGGVATASAAAGTATTAALGGGAMATAAGATVAVAVPVAIAAGVGVAAYQTYKLGEATYDLLEANARGKELDAKIAEMNDRARGYKISQMMPQAQEPLHRLENGLKGMGLPPEEVARQMGHWKKEITMKGLHGAHGGEGLDALNAEIERIREQDPRWKEWERQEARRIEEAREKAAAIKAATEQLEHLKGKTKIELKDYIGEEDKGTFTHNSLDKLHADVKAVDTLLDVASQSKDPKALEQAKQLTAMKDGLAKMEHEQRTRLLLEELKENGAKFNDKGQLDLKDPATYKAVNEKAAELAESMDKNSERAQWWNIAENTKRSTAYESAKADLETLKPTQEAVETEHRTQQLMKDLQEKGAKFNDKGQLDLKDPATYKAVNDKVAELTKTMDDKSVSMWNVNSWRNIPEKLRGDKAYNDAKADLDSLKPIQEALAKAQLAPAAQTPPTQSPPVTSPPAPEAKTPDTAKTKDQLQADIKELGTKVESENKELKALKEAGNIDGAQNKLNEIKANNQKIETKLQTMEGRIPPEVPSGTSKQFHDNSANQFEQEQAALNELKAKQKPTQTQGTKTGIEGLLEMIGKLLQAFSTGDFSKLFSQQTGQGQGTGTKPPVAEDKPTVPAQTPPAQPAVPAAPPRKPAELETPQPIPQPKPRERAELETPQPIPQPKPRERAELETPQPKPAQPAQAPTGGIKPRPLVPPVASPPVEIPINGQDQHVNPAQKPPAQPMQIPPNGTQPMKMPPQQPPAAANPTTPPRKPAELETPLPKPVTRDETVKLQAALSNKYTHENITNRSGQDIGIQARSEVTNLSRDPEKFRQRLAEVTKENKAYEAMRDTVIAKVAEHDKTQPHEFGAVQKQTAALLKECQEKAEKTGQPLAVVMEEKAAEPKARQEAIVKYKESVEAFAKAHPGIEDEKAFVDRAMNNTKIKEDLAKMSPEQILAAAEKNLKKADSIESRVHTAILAESPDVIDNKHKEQLVDVAKGKDTPAPTTDQNWKAALAAVQKLDLKKYGLATASGVEVDMKDLGQKSAPTVGGKGGKQQEASV